MIKSMTGYGSCFLEIKEGGSASAELRSSNHKYLEIVLHLPEGCIFLEDKIKKIIEAKIKRGRIICILNIFDLRPQRVSVNFRLANDYLHWFKKMKSQFSLKGEPSIDNFINLPGVFSVTSQKTKKEKIWPYLKKILEEALKNLELARAREGGALTLYLRARAKIILSEVSKVKSGYAAIARKKAAKIKSEEEKSAFLKNSDISEELSRLKFHAGNFLNKLQHKSPIGKELDFIAQEMQREANTVGAKSCDILISNKAVFLKSQIEKIREQVQNVE